MEVQVSPGDVGALLRRRGVCSSHLTTWRQQHDARALVWRSVKDPPTSPSLELVRMINDSKLRCIDPAVPGRLVEPGYFEAFSQTGTAAGAAERAKPSHE